MPKPKNSAIGECVCPARGCDRVGKVYRFRPRSGGARDRFAGKLYLQCPEHGRFGADGAAAMQDFILENATIWTPETRLENADAPAPSPPTTPAAPAPKPAPRPTPQPASPPAPPPAKKPRDLWDL